MIPEKVGLEDKHHLHLFVISWVLSKGSSCWFSSAKNGGFPESEQFFSTLRSELTQRLEENGQKKSGRSTVGVIFLKACDVGGGPSTEKPGKRGYNGYLDKPLQKKG